MVIEKKKKKKESLCKVINGVGKKMASLSFSPNKDLLLSLLKQAANALLDLDQSAKLKPAITPLSSSLIQLGLLKHKDKDVQLLVSICFCEIIRILAPEPGFSNAELQDIFELFLSLFSDLVDKDSPYFARRLKVLETVDKLRFCAEMVYTTSEDLLLRMFNTFFTIVRENHPRDLFSSMSSIMVQVFKEKASWPTINMILHNLLKEKKGASPASSRLARFVLEYYAAELEHPICEFLNSCIFNRDGVKSELKEFYHEIIFEIFQCAPQMLMTVIPNLKQELLADQVDIRISAISLVGRLLVLPGHDVAKNYGHLYTEFIRRYSDKSADVRIAALKCVKAFYISNPHGQVPLDVLTSLEGRLLDFDDRVRTQAVVTICDLARANLKYLSAELISRAIERLHDKRISVRKKALQKLLEVYEDYCAKCSAGVISLSDNYEQIPCGILLLCYHKDCMEFRPQNMELVLAEELFPASLSIEERTRHWVKLFSLFKPAHLKALSSILSHKRRFQVELKYYLALRKSKEDMPGEEVKQKIQTCVAKLTAFYPDPRKAEENFHNLDSLKDDIIYTTLMQLLDEVSIETAQMTRDNFLKKLGKKHPLFEFLQLLSKKCLFNIFSSEHVHYIVDDLVSSSGDNMANSSVNLLLAIISAFPLLLRNLEKQFRLLLLEDKVPVNEQLMGILVHAGPYGHIKISDIYPSLERICLDGTSTQSKLAVSVIAALNDTSEQLIFAELTKTLVEALHSGQNIPTVLQSLGCIAQYSVSSFESQSGEIYRYIFEEMFQSSNEQVSNNLDSSEETSDHDVSSIWKIPIFAIKSLVRSFLPHKSTTIGRDISQLFEVLLQMLQNGYISNGAIPCGSGKAGIKLAAAKSVLRLSRRWDLHIPPRLFHITVLMAKDRSSSVRRQFVDKIHKLLKHHAVPNKYVCAFALAASDPLKDLQNDTLKYMEDFVRGCRVGAKIRQSSKKLTVTDSPAYIVVFLIHVLAHDPCFPSRYCEDGEIWVQFFSPLVRLLEALVSFSSVDGDKNLIIASVSWLHFMFLAIKRAEDAVDVGKTPKLYMLADMGIAILSIMTCKASYASRTLDPVLLPSSLYRINPADNTEEDNLKFHGECSLNANITKKVLSGITSRISWPSDMFINSSRKVQSCQQSDMIKCSMKNELYKNGDMPMNVEEKIQSSYENMKLDNNTRSKRKLSLSPSPPMPGGLHYELSIEDDVENNMLINFEPLNGKEQVPSSCDSATDGNCMPKRKDECAKMLSLCQLKDHGNNCQVRVGQRIKLWSPDDKCYGPGTVVGFDSSNDTYKITYDNGIAEVVNLGRERWETMSNNSLQEKDSTSFTSEHCDPVISQSKMDNSSQDGICQSKGKANKQRNTFPKKRITHPGKENKGHNACMDTSASEIINVNEEPVARRTRRKR